MQKLIEGLRHFQTHVHWERQELFERSVQGQKPQALLITCSDSRILPDQLMQADPGDLFVHRNAGNLVPSPETPSSEAATIDYAVGTLGVTDIIVCGHYRCGAVKALLDSGGAPGRSPVGLWLRHAADTLVSLARKHPNSEGQERWDRAVEQNVLVQLDSLAQHPVVAAGLAAGKLRLHAWVLRFESSEVIAYDPCVNEFTPLLEMPQVHPAIPARGPEHAPSIPLPTVIPTVRSEVSPPSWLDAVKSDVPASLVVAMVAMPLCLAIARACGVPAEVGLITGIVGGLVVGLLAGSPLQVSGPTAGQIVILLDVVQGQGIGMLGVVVFLAGLIQLVAAGLKLGQWFRAVSPAVILGMMAGIGAVLISQQFHLTVDDPPSRGALQNVLGIPQAIVGIFQGHEGHDGHVPAAVIGLLTLGVLLFWKRVTPRKLHAIPAVMVAVVLTTTLASLLNLPIQRVEFTSIEAGVTRLDFAALSGLLTSGAVWTTALTIAFVASAETLLCASAIDQMHRGPRTRFNRELAAQGIGNAVCGLLGALPVTGVIVRSSTNIQAGARTRLSAILHGVWLLAFVLILPGVLRLVPTAAFAAILVLTGANLIDIRAMRALWNENRAEGWIAIATAVTVVFVSLLAGVILGVALTLAKLIYTFSRLRIRRRVDMVSGKHTLVLEGSATFLRLPKFAAALEKVAPGTVLHIDFKGLSYIDHTCLTLLMNWEKQHAAAGGTLILDWDTLRARFAAENPRPRSNRRVFRPDDSQLPQEAAGRSTEEEHA